MFTTIALTTRATGQLVHKTEKGEYYSYAKGPELVAYFKKLTLSTDPGIREAGQEMLASLEAAAAAIEKYGPAKLDESFRYSNPRKAPATGEAVARMKPLNLEFVVPAHLKLPGIQYDYGIDHWFAIAPRFDVLSREHYLLLMREPGVAKTVWSNSRCNLNGIEKICFDGKYIWATGRRDSGWLLICDPQSEQTWEFNTNDGLLPHNVSVALAALEPGKICMIGGFHKERETISLDYRGWIAHITFKPAEGVKINVILEAKELVNDTNIAPVEAAFVPGFAFTVGTGQDQRVLVSRGVHSHVPRPYDPPLIINPHKLTVSLWSQRPDQIVPGKARGPWSSVAVVQDHALYFSEQDGVDGPLHVRGWKPPLYRAEAPLFKVNRIGQMPFMPFDRKEWRAGPSSVVEHAGKFYFITPEIYEMDPVTAKCRIIPHVYPDGTTGWHEIFASSHFGLVFCRSVEVPGDYSQGMFQLEIPKLTVGENR
jgi:hypothetical protein